MTIQRILGVSVGPVLALLLATPASAQTPGTQMSTPAPPQHSLTLGGSFGYLVVHPIGVADARTPAGWVWSIDGLFDGKFAVVGEFAGGAGAHHSSLGGVRFMPGSRRVSPFVQLLVGKARGAATGDEASRFTLQPSAGLQFWVIPHVGVRVQTDFDWQPRVTESTNALRFGMSIVIR